MMCNLAKRILQTRNQYVSMYVVGAPLHFSNNNVEVLIN